jgi:hypothetical protein
MGRTAQRRRQRPHRSRREHPGRIASIEGVPVYDGIIVDMLTFGDDPDDVQDARIVIGIGPEGRRPRAFVALCPCDGVRGLVGELERLGAIASEYHPPHLPPLAA